MKPEIIRSEPAGWRYGEPLHYRIWRSGAWWDGRAFVPAGKGHMICPAKVYRTLAAAERAFAAALASSP